MISFLCDEVSKKLSATAMPYKDTDRHLSMTFASSEQSTFFTHPVISLEPATATHISYFARVPKMPGCPFAGAGAAAQTSGQSAHAEGDVSACPAMRALMAGNGGAAPPEAGAAPPDAAPTTAAVCPLGFGSSRGPRLSTLHCTLCRGLLHEPVTTDACSHTFCRACITRARDCVICGADIKSLSPNEELERLVQTFLDTHSKSPQLVAAQVRGTRSSSSATSSCCVAVALAFFLPAVQPCEVQSSNTVAAAAAVPDPARLSSYTRIATITTTIATTTTFTG